VIIEQRIFGQDNFVVVAHDEIGGKTFGIDAPDAGLMLEILRTRGWSLDYLLITHHHGDHTAGIEQLKRETDALIIGPAAEAAKINGLDRHVQDGETFSLGNNPVEAIATPGHTAGGMSYYLPENGLVFTGDTLFSLGCGRLFEGSPAMMLRSLQKLKQLPDATKLYCGHEYTQNNGRFALSVDGDNEDLKLRMREVENLRAKSAFTLPSTIGVEKRTNPFLRYDNAHIAKNLGLEGSDDVTIFARLRQLKDRF